MLRQAADAFLVADAPHAIPRAPRYLLLLVVSAHFLFHLLSPSSRLSASDRVSLGGSAVALALFYLAGREALRPARAGDAEAERHFRKRRAWLVVLVPAVICTAVASVLEPRLLLDVAFAPDAAAARELFLRSVEHDTWGSRFVTLMMWSELVVDLWLGTLEYAEHLPLLSWFHHCVYVFIMQWLCDERICGGFGALLLNEAPVVLLALGSIDARLRLDLPFGVSYFATRIVLCGVQHYLHFLWNPRQFVWMFMCGAMLLHCVWFAQWVLSYRRRVGRKSAAKAE
jgi:hypothetical protein